MTVLYIISLISTFVVTAVTLRFLIPILKSKKMGQKILDIGPRWHKSKEGTPTMGGLSFLLGITLVCAVLYTVLAVRGEKDGIAFCAIALGFSVCNAFIGMIDDRTKFAKKTNQGLLSWQKYLLQLIVTAVFLFISAKLGFITDMLYIPFFKEVIDLGPLYYVFAAILITGVINSVNLADGIDGLASSETAVVAAFFSAVAFKGRNDGLAILSGSTLGGCLGFLLYNFYPARVFMGDTGSLFLGALVTSMAFICGNPLIIVICGFVYIMEAISDIIQVGYFKLTHGKRFFKMAPIHHHFEKCGWSEIKVVTVFTLTTLVLCAISYLFDIM